MRRQPLLTETAVVLLTFFRAMRGNEAVPDSPGNYDAATHISVCAVTMPPHAQAIVIRIPKTKNRQPGHRDGSGTLMYITASKPNDRLDPYWWILDQFQRRRAARASPTAPFFADPHGLPISRAQVEKRLQAAANGDHPAIHVRPDMNDVVAGVVRLRGHPVCPGWGVHDDILATTH
jgi:hypothetical protein